jgi:hypothetical protein
MRTVAPKPEQRGLLRNAQARENRAGRGAVKKGMGRLCPAGGAQRVPLVRL